jgi:hypothetical protein
MNQTVAKNDQGRLGPLLLWGILLLFLLTVFFVNPFRETAYDDDWAYALTVKNLLETGQYRAHDWISANMPFQAYWGGLFTHFLGYSHASLRISTLALVFVGLIAFYSLAREHGLEQFTAGLLTMTLLASPIFLLFSFSFMTDVPFLVLLILALLFYTRSLRLRSYSWLILASIAASAAILTRQLGMALVPAVFFAWFFSGRERRDVSLILVGLALPAAASILQLYAGAEATTWAAGHLSSRQWQYMGKAIGAHIIWRPGIILQYLALFSIPLVLAAFFAFCSEFRSRNAARLNVRLLVEIGIYIVLGMLWIGRIMPVLPWNFGDLNNHGLAAPCLLTVVTSTGAILYASIFLMRYYDSENWKKVPPEQRILDFTTLFLVSLHLVYVDIADRYLLDLMPFTLIVVGIHLNKWLIRYRLVTLLTCLVAFSVSAMWTRSSLEACEAYWQAAELIRNKGVEARQIYGSWMWNCYYGFDDYLADVNSGGRNRMTDFSTRWLPERRDKAEYLVVSYQESPSRWITAIDEKSVYKKWEIVAREPYKGFFFQEKNALVIKKPPQ